MSAYQIKSETQALLEELTEVDIATTAYGRSHFKGVPEEQKLTKLSFCKTCRRYKAGRPCGQDEWRYNRWANAYDSTCENYL